jgi:catechol 2,3-dioxygenase-like lactoylglutathione lyase family enzyme
MFDHVGFPVADVARSRAFYVAAHWRRLASSR